MSGPRRGASGTKSRKEGLLPYDPIPWLMEQEGLAALRARRVLGLSREGDEKVVSALGDELRKEQLRDGSFEQSPINTAGVLNLASDLGIPGPEKLVASGASYLVSVLASQPGYERARSVRPGSLGTACDLCGFFGPYEDRNRPERLAHGAREMNFYREHEPLLGPKSPVRRVRTSTLDRPGPGSCYAWGLIPLSYTIEALCRAGYARDERVRPAINALLGAQRESGGWCRSLGGHPSCSVHALRALGSHPRLKRSRHGEGAVEFIRGTRQWWEKGSARFGVLQALAAFDLPVARETISEEIPGIVSLQRRNGTFGGACRVERVAAVLLATRALVSGDNRCRG
jgi:hypothetical protein